MVYTEEFFSSRKKEIDNLLHFLQECKFAGSWDTKVDLNFIIKNIANSSYIIDVLRGRIKELENKINEQQR